MKQIIKKILVLVLAAPMLLPNTTFAAAIDLTVAHEPTVALLNGEKFRVTILIQNTTSQPSTNTIVSFEAPPEFEFQSGNLYYMVNGQDKSNIGDKIYTDMIGDPGYLIGTIDANNQAEIEFDMKVNTGTSQSISATVDSDSMNNTVKQSERVVIGSGTDPNCNVDSGNLQNSGQKLCNPLTSRNLDELVARIIRLILSVVGGLAVLMILEAGAVMITAGGNEESITAAKSRITWAIIGLLVSILAYSFVAIIENALH